jgi:hypothetical protein
MEEGYKRGKSRIQSAFFHTSPLPVHCKKISAIFPSPAWMSLTKLSLAGKKSIIPGAVESLVSDIPAGEGKIANLFLQCVMLPALYCRGRNPRNFKINSSHRHCPILNQSKLIEEKFRS